jgi:hypothetical protein
MIEMSLSGILLGLLNIAIVLVILVLIGAIIVWVFSMLGWPIPWNIQRLYLAIVALIGLTMVVALLFGLAPHWRVVHDFQAWPAIAT